MEDGMPVLFVDLDGVLVDFDQGVRRVCGADPGDLKPSVMWKALASARGFYEHLDWLPGARDFWKALAPWSPSILTGLPMGRWAEGQKRRWCEVELGPDVRVLTGLSRDKPRLARELVPWPAPMVLVDDRQSLQTPWEELGGIFVWHRDPESSFKALVQIMAGFGDQGS